MRAVRYDDYGDIDRLEVREVDEPAAADGRVVVRVKATAINPGELMILSGAMAEQWPATFPSGSGSDLAGVVESGAAGGFGPGDEVIGWTDDRAAHAELVSVPGDQLVARPASVAWEVAGALHVAGATAWASVRAIDLTADDTVVVSAAAGGVGTLAIQLVARTGARVIALASDDHHNWLRAHGAEPMAYGDDLADRLRAEAPTALLDNFGDGYVALALDLGIAPERINTIIDFAAIEAHGVHGDGNAEGASAETIAAVAGLVAAGDLEVPIAQTYPLAEVRQAFRDLADRHSLGKRVLVP